MEKRTKYLLLSVLLLCLICIITSGYSYAKYVSNSVWDNYLESQGFYFSSKELDSTKVVNVNNNWNNDSTYFTIENSINEYLITNYDIEYTVKCTIQNATSNYSECKLNGEDSDEFTGVLSSSYVCKDNTNNLDVSKYTKEECISNNYQWSAQKNYKELYFDIVPTSDKEINNVSVLIEVSTDKPYKKTITGEFNLNSSYTENNILEVNYKEYNDYNRVIITNSYDEDKCVKLNWNSSDLRIDESNNKIITSKKDENGYINEIIFNISKKDSISYIFYKTDFNKFYDSKAFTLIETNECLTLQ